MISNRTTVPRTGGSLGGFVDSPEGVAQLVKKETDDSIGSSWWRGGGCIPKDPGSPKLRMGAWNRNTFLQR